MNRALLSKIHYCYANLTTELHEKSCDLQMIIFHSIMQRSDTVFSSLQQKVYSTCIIT